MARYSFRIKQNKILQKTQAAAHGANGMQAKLSSITGLEGRLTALSARTKWSTGEWRQLSPLPLCHLLEHQSQGMLEAML